MVDHSCKYDSTAQLASARFDSLAAKIAGDYADSPTAKILRDYANSPAAKILRDYASSPTAKILRDYSNNSTAKILSDYANGPMASMASDTKFVGGHFAYSSMWNPLATEKKIAQSLGVERTFVAPTRQFAHELVTFNAKLKLPTELESFRTGGTALERSLVSARSPWLDFGKPHQSVYAFDSLSAIASAARTDVPFSEASVKAMRAVLGDWRDISNIKLDALLDTDTRKQLYREQGLDAGLTEFPSNAYPEILQLTGLFGSSNKADRRTVDRSSRDHLNRGDIGVVAFQLLRTFEIGFRVFLAHLMSRSCGTKWIKQRVSENARNRWTERRAAAIEDGEIELPLHDYADIFDYAEIIIRSDNWDEVFSAIFRNKDEVQVSFRRLNAARRPVMHGREVTNEDLLLIGTEIAQLRNAILKSGHKL
jgi:Swt1-like HEPN